MSYVGQTRCICQCRINKRRIIFCFLFRLIIGKPERKLKKGLGIHLDIVIVCLINIICGFCGFPWLCVAAVRSIVHTSALTVMSRTHAPGEKPHLIEVKEQRLSAFFVSIFIGEFIYFLFIHTKCLVILIGLFLIFCCCFRIVCVYVPSFEDNTNGCGSRDISVHGCCVH